MKLLKLLIEDILSEKIFWHGTGHYFKSFRQAGIGGGSGAQVYGWGFYLTTQLSMASGYEGLGASSQTKLFLNDLTPQELAFKYDCIVFERIPQSLKTIDELVEYAEFTIELLEEDNDTGEYDELINEYKRFITIIKQFEVSHIDNKYIYKVKINEGIYLNWDNHTLSNEEINIILTQAKKENLNIKKEQIQNINFVTGNLNGIGGPKEISLFLNRAGIKGYVHSNDTVRIVINPIDLEILHIYKGEELKKIK